MEGTREVEMGIASREILRKSGRKSKGLRPEIESSDIISEELGGQKLL
jgi:hypothetical protein